MHFLINKKLFRSKELLIINYSLLILLLGSCSVSSQISKVANKTILRDSAASKGFIGISIYEPATNKYWYNYNATKYFTPASNTKLFTLYAGMRYLGDSLVTAKLLEYDDRLFVFPNADPTFMNPEFANQPLLERLRGTNKSIIVNDTAWKENALGYGWAWDDYNDDYMAERSPMPVYGNVVSISGTGNSPNVIPSYFKAYLTPREGVNSSNFISAVKRNKAGNVFVTTQKGRAEKTFIVPFETGGYFTSLKILEQESGKSIAVFSASLNKDQPQNTSIIKSIPVDSLFLPMMHRSDNFFAEQTLLMVSNERLGYMSDADIIDTLLKSDLKDIPQRPKWVDGSGLSRYNLFTPQSFVYILNKLRNEFDWDRLRNILPTGGEGTLTSYFHNDRGFIYAKTGTLSNNCALSGFLLTNSGKLLIFSILANHYQGGATPVRKASERFLEEIRKKY